MNSETMNANEAALRAEMKLLLDECSEKERDVFRRMYDPDGKCEHPVDAIPANKMDWAFSQIERTLAKKEGR